MTRTFIRGTSQMSQEFNIQKLSRDACSLKFSWWRWRWWWNVVNNKVGQKWVLLAVFRTTSLFSRAQRNTRILFSFFLNHRAIPYFVLTDELRWNIFSTADNISSLLDGPKIQNGDILFIEGIILTSLKTTKCLERFLIVYEFFNVLNYLGLLVQSQKYS